MFIQQYLIPYLDIKLELFSLRESEKATKYQLNTQAASFDFIRRYPEAQQTNQSDVQAIGFQYVPPSEYEDDECRIGF